MQKILIKIFILFLSIGLTACADLSLSSSSTTQLPPSAELQSNLWQGSSTVIWNQLQHMSLRRLVRALNQTQDPASRAWLELALISKRYSTNTQSLVHELIIWQEKYPTHAGNSLMPNRVTLETLSQQSPPKHVALLLPLQGAYGQSGQTVRSGFLNAYYDKPSSKQAISFYNTAQGQSVTALYQQALSQGADFIVGPLLKEDVRQLSRLGSFDIPILALNYTDIYSGSLSTNFYEFGLLPEDEATEIAERALKNKGRRALIITIQNTWGQRMATSFTQRLRNLGGNIIDTWYFTPQSNFNEDIARFLKINPQIDKQMMQNQSDKKALQMQRRQDFDVIFLFSDPESARIIVPLLRYYYVDNVPIYASATIYSGKPNPAKDMDLNGVTVCDAPWNMRSHTHIAEQSDRLYAVGQDAYLLTHTLQRLILLPNFPLYAATGALTLSPKHQIHRRLPCATFHNGRLS